MFEDCSNCNGLLDQLDKLSKEVVVLKQELKESHLVADNKRLLTLRASNTELAVTVERLARDLSLAKAQCYGYQRERDEWQILHEHAMETVEKIDVRLKEAYEALRTVSKMMAYAQQKPIHGWFVLFEDIRQHPAFKAALRMVDG